MTMNILDEKIIDAIKDGSSALALAKEIKSDMKTEFYSLKESIRYDMQNILSSNIELAIKKGLEEHYDKVARPHIEKVSQSGDANSQRITVLESDKKAIKWVVLAISGMASTVYNFIAKYF